MPSATEGDYSTWKPSKMTKGLSISSLKNMTDPENGDKNMTEKLGQSNFKEAKFISADYKSNSKPGYYWIDEPNVDKVNITDTVTGSTFTL